MRLLTLGEVLELHRLVIAQVGGVASIQDRGALESAAAQPFATFDGQDLYRHVAWALSGSAPTATPSM